VDQSELEIILAASRPSTAATAASGTPGEALSKSPLIDLDPSVSMCTAGERWLSKLFFRVAAKNDRKKIRSIFAKAGEKIDAVAY
jgi:hypothetical protein